MTPFGYIGIDFGMSNSHFAYCNSDGDARPQTIRLAGQEAVTTCVLWRQPAQEEGDILAYGAEALETWAHYEAGEPAGCHFAFGFKPDLVKSERAHRDASAFLLKARQEIQRAGLPRPIAPGGMAVVVGVPAEVGDEHRRRTAEAARAAGFGDVQCVEEPLGALAFHLNTGDITLAKARAGVVVVDFGGGTLDVALVSPEGLHETWGDPALGGRLFDDLFFQWLCDKNGPLRVDEREALAVWQKECRELKENFSDRWRTRGDGMADFKGHVFVGDTRRWLRDASVREFEERAGRYRPSAVARRYFRGLDQAPGDLAVDTPVDLFDWIRRTLTRQESPGSLRGRFSKVILTGGSCHWPFMTRLAAEAFGVDPERDVLLSHSPETTIGSGLALYHVLKLRHEARRLRLREQKPAAKAQVQAAVAERFDRFAAEAADAVLAELMPRVENIFWEWYRHGGSLKHVEELVEMACRDCEPQIAQTMAGLWRALDADLVRLLRDHLRQFLADNEIPRDVSRYIPESASLRGVRTEGSDASDKIAVELRDLAAALTALTMAVGTLVVAALKIHLIIVAAFAHPLLAVVIGLEALVAALDLGEVAGAVVERAVKNHEFNRLTLPLLKAGLWETKFRKLLARGRAEAREKLGMEIRQSTRQLPEGAAVSSPGGRQAPPIEGLAVEKFERIIDLVIQDLGVLELAGSGCR